MNHSSSNNYVCPICQCPEYVRDPSFSDGGPTVQNIYLHPMQRRQDLTQQVEHLYFSRHISKFTYDHWYEITDRAYQVDTSRKLTQLWSERLNDLQFLTTDEQLKLIRRGLKIQRKDKDGDKSKENQPMTSNQTDEVEEKIQSIINNEVVDLKSILKFKGYHIYQCMEHKCLKVKLKYSVLRKKKDYKQLNVLFPWDEVEDKKKTNLDLRSLVYFATRRNKMSVIDEVMRTYFKSITVAVRRTLKWIDGSKLKAEDVGSLGYYELSTGRASHTTDWTEEKDKRVGPILPLRNPWNGNSLDEDLQVELERQINKLVDFSVRWEDWKDFVESRQQWATSGSAGGVHININGKKVRLNKHSYFEMLTTKEMIHWLEEEPEIFATGSEKFEPGKSRAIYGFILGYGLYGFDNIQSVKGVEKSLKGTGKSSQTQSQTKNIKQKLSSKDIKPCTAERQLVELIYGSVREDLQIYNQIVLDHVYEYVGKQILSTTEANDLNQTTRISRFHSDHILDALLPVVTELQRNDCLNILIDA
ncbi:hypothetical protein GJ496_005103 [Pomphorhynchus laevis]|nr:hypothetical protein GJ496_005103 [Pomphorhynchus laevis]